jgi:hypothetical protein
VMQGNNRIGLSDTFHLGRLCGPELRNGTGFFLVPGFPVPDPARGAIARERNQPRAWLVKETRGHRRSSCLV